MRYQRENEMVTIFSLSFSSYYYYCYYVDVFERTDRSKSEPSRLKGVENLGVGDRGDLSNAFPNAFIGDKTRRKQENEGHRRLLRNARIPF